MKSLAVQTIDADLENFLSKVLDSRALANVRKTCIKEEVFTLASLKELRDAKQLNIFTKGTETRIYNTLPGQLCLMLVTGVHISMKAAYPQKAYTKEFKRYFWRHQMILYVKWRLHHGIYCLFAVTKFTLTKYNMHSCSRSRPLQSQVVTQMAGKSAGAAAPEIHHSSSPSIQRFPTQVWTWTLTLTLTRKWLTLRSDALVQKEIDDILEKLTKYRGVLWFQTTPDGGVSLPVASNLGLPEIVEKDVMFVLLSTGGLTEPAKSAFESCTGFKRRIDVLTIPVFESVHNHLTPLCN